MAKKRKLGDTVQLKLRFPEALRRRLEQEAKRHGASLNSEIIRTLEDRFRESDDRKDQAHAIADMVAELLSSEVEDAIANALWQVERAKEKRAAEAERAEAERHMTEAEREARQAEENKRKVEEEARTKRVVADAVRTIERAGFKIARLPKSGNSAASETKDGEKK
jgi:hypothetical protein